MKKSRYRIWRGDVDKKNWKETEGGSLLFIRSYLFFHVPKYWFFFLHLFTYALCSATVFQNFSCFVFFFLEGFFVSSLV